MNNYKKQPFIPAIQKTSTLLALSIIAMVGFIISLNSTKVEVSSSYDIKVKAAMNMQESMNILKSSRMVSGVFIDDENDPNETGLVGSPFSLITTDEGDLDAKLTTLDPNFAAGMVELMTQLSLQKGDTVAVLMTGSMPGANVAVLTALKSLSVIPVTITSVGASQWGANQVDFTWLDMEKILFEKINEIRKSFTVKEDRKNYEDLLAQLASVRLLTDQFFDNVVVNDENQDIKNNRLELLSMFCKVFNNFLDFSKLEGA